MINPVESVGYITCYSSGSLRQFKSIKASTNVSNVSWRVAHVFGILRTKSTQNIYVIFTNSFSPGLLNLGTQIRCAWNQYTTVQKDLKYPQ